MITVYLSFCPYLSQFVRAVRKYMVNGTVLMYGREMSNFVIVYSNVVIVNEIIKSSFEVFHIPSFIVIAILGINVRIHHNNTVFVFS